MIDEKIIQIKSNKPGPTLAIFAGVHGNETAGVFALQELLPKLTLTKGSLFIAFANPPAIEADVRMITKNLNRCFLKENDGTDYEDARARELMKVLDGCDALLDLHMFYDEDGLPFVICEPSALELAKIFDVDIISTNWTEVEPGGTDGYMFTNGKIGICVECGPIAKATEYTEFAKRTIYQFLSYFDMTDKKPTDSSKLKRIIRADKAVYKTSADFHLLPNFKNFERLNEGQTIAREHDQTFTAKAGDCIIFPHYSARVGEEAYILGTEQLDESTAANASEHL